MAQEKDTTGYIYILTNEFMPGLVKIGKTIRNTGKRAKELSSPTGVPTEFEVVYQLKVSNCHEAEKKIHWELRHVRVNDGREFFKLDVDEAIKIVTKICDKYSVSKVVMPPPPAYKPFTSNNHAQNTILTLPVFTSTFRNKPKANDVEAIKLFANGCVRSLAILSFCVICSCCGLIFAKPLPPPKRSIIEISATPELPLTPLEVLPTPTVEIAPTPTLYSEAENPPKEPQIVWIYQLQGISTDVNRWEVWTEAVEPQVKGYMTWNEFKEQVLLHNPNLDKNNPVFHPNEIYVMPGLQ